MNNADTILPEELLYEVQKYVQGRSLYIPKLRSNYKKWGDGTRSKAETSVRNDRIRSDFRNGLKINELCGKYSLSQSSIKKIVYDNTCRKNISHAES